VLEDDPNLKKQYRMPRVFGALPGPRNVPRDKQPLRNNQHNTVLTVTASSDAGMLAALLPPECALDGEPRFTVTFNFMQQIGWLAGHGYALITVSIPMQHASMSQGLQRGLFLPVIWENLADPILTGREELGWAKLYADIPPAVVVSDNWSVKALWQGFTFLELEVHGLVPTATSAAPTGQFHYKYIPRTGELSEAEVAYLEYSPPGVSAAGYEPLPVTGRWSGNGSFKFHRARWEDMPFQYPIINALSDLPVAQFTGATLTKAAAKDGIGDPAGGSLRQTD
jgi:hypothetical protein